MKNCFLALLGFALLAGLGGCSMFHVTPTIPSAPAITSPTTPTTVVPTVPTVPEKQVKILKGGWWCLVVGIILLAATFTLVPITTRKYTGGTAALLIAMWPISEFLSWLVPYLPYIGAVILVGGLTAVIVLLWRRIKELICSTEKLHALPNWNDAKKLLSEGQSEAKAAIVKTITEKAKCTTPKQ